ncbi:MAG: CMP-N-acetlyneuraminic acid synthetase [Parcubacteria group bacterium CG10_big_fil_rev_8_21_14_0_10_36_14]|nr:MAG: CMP-N-acetlyneuraminic acid synthetase [Parcubacteria group bacterium CG10_big_fil_rev_8_21_14_0_10_36_14]
MYKNKKIVAVIPARGGSKRILEKNIIDLNGKPLLAYSVELAKKISIIDKIVVSSDSEKILSIASAYGAEALKRSAELSGDMIKTEPVLINVLDEFLIKGEIFDYLLLLEPTSPMREQHTIEKMIYKVIDEGFDSVGTVIEDRSYFWLINKDSHWAPLFSNASRRSQERDPLYKEAGVGYIIKSSVLKESGKILGGKSAFIVVEEKEGVDINTLFDLEIARFLLK